MPTAEPHPEQDLLARLALPDAAAAPLRRALTHKSYSNEHGGVPAESYERLEFLGDAILGAITADLLFDRYPERQEGDLTAMRAWLVRQPTLARWARTLDLGSYVLLGQGEERPGVRDRDSLLARVFEAIVGATYRAAGYEGARRLLTPILEAEIAAGDPMERAMDAKSRLQQRAQALFGITPSYEDVGSSGPDHDPTVTVRVLAGEQVSALGTGRGKRAAQQAAAAAALAELDRTHPELAEAAADASADSAEAPHGAVTAGEGAAVEGAEPA